MTRRYFWPQFYFDGDGDGGGGSGGTGSTGSNTGGDNGGTGGEQTRTFKQSELDAMFADRAKQAGQSAVAGILKDLGVEKIDDIKGILKAAKDAEAAKLSELEKAQKEAADLKAAKEKVDAEKADILAKAAEKLLKAAVLAEASKQGFNDPTDAWNFLDRSAIKAKDDDSYEGLDKAIEAVAKAKPYLVKAQQQSQGKGTPSRDKKPAGDKQADKQDAEQPTVRVNF